MRTPVVNVDFVAPSERHVTYLAIPISFCSEHPVCRVEMASSRRD